MANQYNEFREQMNHALDVYSRDFVADHARFNQLKQLVNDKKHMLSQTFDADGSFFFERELTNIEARVYRKKYADIKARECIPTLNQGDASTRKHAYQVYDRVGEAKVINFSNPNVIPIIDVTSKEVEVNVAPLAGAKEYSLFDIAAAQRAGRPLEAEKLMSLRDVAERKIETIAWIGEDSYGIEGFLTNSLIPTENVVNGVGGNPEWDTKTPSEILFDVLDAIASILSLTQDVEIPDTVLLPTYQYNLLIQPRSDVSDTTLLQWLAQNVPVLNGNVQAIKSVPFLAGRGVGNTDRMVVYRKDPEKLNLVVPVEFTMYNPVPLDLGWKISSYASTAGTIVRYPLSVTFRDSI